MHAQDEVSGAVQSQDTTQLRLAALFIILIAGLCGALPPLFMKAFRNHDGLASQLSRSLAAGVILALALVHIIPEAIEDMSGLGGMTYPLGGLCVLGGVALMLLLEHLSQILHNSQAAVAAAAGTGGCGHSHGSSSRGRDSGLVNDHRRRAGTAHLAGDPKHQGHGAHAHAKHTLPPHHPGAHGHTAEQQHKPHAQQHPASYEQLPPQHQHTCVTYGNAPSLLTIAVGNGGEAAVGGDAAAAGGLGGGSLRLRLLAYMFELGCVFHSLIIGVAVGVITEDVAQVRALLIALSFHQWLEGLGLGSVIARGGFSTLKAAAMAGFYSLTCPAGVAAGMALARLYDPESEVARGVQGTLDGVSGGMLLYISLVQLVAEDMGRFVPAGGEGGAGAGRRLMSFAALCGGAGAMCLLAVWT
eukprot:XP_001702077.1 ZIP family transporter [Chlamydomonas reinhardtii]